jgi:hypothetical protein
MAPFRTLLSFACWLPCTSYVRTNTHPPTHSLLPASAAATRDGSVVPALPSTSRATPPTDSLDELYAPIYNGAGIIAIKTHEKGRRDYMVKGGQKRIPKAGEAQLIGDAAAAFITTEDDGGKGVGAPAPPTSGAGILSETVPMTLAMNNMGLPFSFVFMPLNVSLSRWWHGTAHHLYTFRLACGQSNTTRPLHSLKGGIRAVRHHNTRGSAALPFVPTPTPHHHRPAQDRG